MSARRPVDDEARHHDVLVAVYELIAAHGIDGTTMRQVAAAAGLSTGTLNYHFTNKRGLILAALDYAYRLPRDWHRYEGSARARLGRIARNYTLDRPQLASWWRFWVEVTAHAARDVELQAHQRAQHRALVEFVAHVLSDGVASGELRADIDPATEAVRFVGLAHGLVLHQLLDPDGAPAAATVLPRVLEGAVGPNPTVA